MERDWSVHKSIYQSSARFEYLDPRVPDAGWISDRQFRKGSQIKRYAEDLRIAWEPEWSSRDKVLWDKIPSDLRKLLKAQADRHKASCQMRTLPLKHKYVYFLAPTKCETNRLRERFKSLNPELHGLKYPKIRGPEYFATAAKIVERQENALTKNSQNCRPPGREDGRAILTVKEVSEMLRISQWTVYHLIKTDPSFPSMNVGIKKKFVVRTQELMSWMEGRAKSLTSRDQSQQSKGG
jgi:predicted DNA-binding transcriptional regulator AlpA